MCGGRGRRKVCMCVCGWGGGGGREILTKGRVLRSREGGGDKCGGKSLNGD